MFLDIPIQADLEVLRQRRKAIIDPNSVHEYQVDDLVLIRNHNCSTLAPPTLGPFRVLDVNEHNGTVLIHHDHNIEEVINIYYHTGSRQSIKSPKW
jgi:hypothetical protein